MDVGLGDAPPRLNVASLDPEDFFGLQVEVFPRTELGLAGLVREDAGEDGLRVSIDLDLAPLDGEDAGRDGNVRGPLPQIHHPHRGGLADVRLARPRLELRERIW